MSHVVEELVSQWFELRFTSGAVNKGKSGAGQGQFHTESRLSQTVRDTSLLAENKDIRTRELNEPRRGPLTGL